MQASQDSDEYRAGLALVTGQLFVENLDAIGGDSPEKRVAMDLDQNLTIDVDTHMYNVVNVSVAAGKTFNTKHLTMASDTWLTTVGETGGGLPQGKLVAQD
jgi:hypothetical protein